MELQEKKSKGVDRGVGHCLNEHNLSNFFFDSNENEFEYVWTEPFKIDIGQTSIFQIISNCPMKFEGAYLF